MCTLVSGTVLAFLLIVYSMDVFASVYKPVHLSMDIPLPII